MNFEFKSTFKITNPVRNVAQFIVRTKKKSFGLFIVAFNTIGVVTAGTLYLNNIILPATIGSRYYGQLYMHLFELAGWLVLASTCFGLTLSISHKLPETYLDIPVALVRAVRAFFVNPRKQIAKIYLVVTLVNPFGSFQERAITKLIRQHYPSWCWPA